MRRVFDEPLVAERLSTASVLRARRYTWRAAAGALLDLHDELALGPPRRVPLTDRRALACRSSICPQTRRWRPPSAASTPGWRASWPAAGLLVAAERQEVTDRTASHRWYLRFKGEEKDFITVWFTLRQRTLHHEVQFMPAPEENVADTLAYLMRCNANLYGMWFSLGPEDAVYLVGKVPAALIDDDELDRIAGSSVHLRRRPLPDGHDPGLPRPVPPPAPPVVASGSRIVRPCRTLLIVGGGKMGSALLGGLLASGWATPEQVAVVETRGRAPRGAGPRVPRACAILDAPDRGPARDAPDRARRSGAGRQARRGRRGLPGPRGRRGDPGAVDRGRHPLRCGWRPPWVGSRSVVRAMPNTPALVGAGVTAISGRLACHLGRPGLGRGRAWPRSARWSGCPSACSIR